MFSRIGADWARMALLGGLLGVVPSAPRPATAVHVGDLDDLTGQGALDTGRISATVQVWVHDSAHRAVTRARVRASWSGGIFGSSNCETDQTGSCTLTSRPFDNAQGLQLTVTIRGVEGPEMEFQKDANHDSDRDSNGSTLTITR